MSSRMLVVHASPQLARMSPEVLQWAADCIGAACGVMEPGDEILTRGRRGPELWISDTAERLGLGMHTLRPNCPHDRAERILIDTAVSKHAQGYDVGLLILSPERGEHYANVFSLAVSAGIPLIALEFPDELSAQDIRRILRLP